MTHGSICHCCLPVYAQASPFSLQVQFLSLLEKKNIRGLFNAVGYLSSSVLTDKKCYRLNRARCQMFSGHPAAKMSSRSSCAPLPPAEVETKLRGCNRQRTTKKKKLGSFFAPRFIVVLISTENKGKWEEEGFNSASSPAQMFTFPAPCKGIVCPGEEPLPPHKGCQLVEIA